MVPRDTKWRQGSILLHHDSQSLDILNDNDDEKCVVVISHDCDIPNEKEKQMEVIVGKKIPKIDASYASSKNVRCLHLMYESPENDKSLFVELKHSGRKLISKEKFFKYAKEPDLLLSDKEKKALKQWLAARYGRPAFPNEFENRLRSDKKFEKKFNNILKSIDPYLIAIFIDLGEERSKELIDQEPYYLKFYLVYDNTLSLNERGAIEKASREITQLFHFTFGTPEIAKQIALESCEAIADEFFSFADIRKVDQWIRHDYISLKKGSTSPQLQIGAALH